MKKKRKKKSNFMIVNEKCIICREWKVKTNQNWWHANVGWKWKTRGARAYCPTFESPFAKPWLLTTERK